MRRDNLCPKAAMPFLRSQMELSSPGSLFSHLLKQIRIGPAYGQRFIDPRQFNHRAAGERPADFRDAGHLTMVLR